MARDRILERYLAENVRWLRESYQWPARELAERVTDTGVPMTEDTVYKIEGSRRRAYAIELLCLATVFGLPAEQLFMAPNLRGHHYAAALARHTLTFVMSQRFQQKQLLEDREKWVAEVERLVSESPEVARSIFGRRSTKPKLRTFVEAMIFQTGSGELSRLRKRLGLQDEWSS